MVVLEKFAIFTERVQRNWCGFVKQWNYFLGTHVIFQRVQLSNHADMLHGEERGWRYNGVLSITQEVRRLCGYTLKRTNSTVQDV